MSLTDAFETSILELIFKNTSCANIGDATGLVGSSTAGNFYISLHTASPGETGDQTTSEATYTGYARIAVVRSGSGWTVASGSATNAAAVTFALCTAGTNTITHFGIGTASTGAGHLVLSDPLTASLSVSTGITPNFPIGALVVTAA